MEKIIEFDLLSCKMSLDHGVIFRANPNGLELSYDPGSGSDMDLILF